MLIRNESVDPQLGVVTATVIDTDARILTVEVDGTPVSSRPLTVGENITVDGIVANATHATNVAAVSDATDLTTKFSVLKAFIDDPDVQAQLARDNQMAPTAAELNRVLKDLIGQVRRLTNMEIRTAKYVFGQLHPELLQDVTEV